MKYAEITVILNLNEESIFYRITRFLGHENQTNETDTLILLFGDGTICDVKKEYIDKKFTLGPLGFQGTGPLHFTPPGKATFFSKTYTNANGVKKMNFNHIFSCNPTYFAYEKDSSIFNMIYQTGVEVFAIVKIVSSETSPRYLLAYEEEFFNKDDIIYLVNQVFSSRK